MLCLVCLYVGVGVIVILFNFVIIQAVPNSSYIGETMFSSTTSVVPSSVDSGGRPLLS